jgi:[ribosomal protein S5]-alanine N-acetyltransferase
MKLSGVSIKTDRLLIREFKPSDWKNVNDYSRLTKTVRFLPWGPDSPAQTRAFLNHTAFLRKQKPRLSFELAIVLQKENKIIGGCGLRIKSRQNRETDLGYVLHPQYWGNGYVTEAARAMVEFGFKHLKMHRIWATCDIKNKASEKILKKCGMRKEGRLRSHLRLHGRWSTSLLYAILETDPSTTN